MGEAMSLTTINVEVPHTLGVEEAIARLSKGDAKPSMVKLTQVIARFVAELPGVSLPGRVVIGNDLISVETDPSYLTMPVDWLAENRIKAKLEELLK
jgi:predicted transcriptional regulator